MENKTVALENYKKLCASNAPVEQRVAAWDNYLAAANTPRSSKYAKRRDGRTFGVRWNGNGNYSDIN